MKNLDILFLVCLFVFTNNISAQEDITIFGEDTFTYEKIDIIDRDKGTTVPLLKSQKKLNSKIKSSSVAKNSNSGVGETPGNLSVSLTGGANYEVPVAIPPGIGGIAPEIALLYNSQSGNGLAGFGWNVSGISSISKIPASKYHDGQIDVVDFDLLDRWALDGQRLILKSGTYGGSATFETEKFSNIKITAHGNSPYGPAFGPAYFLVNYPDGSMAKYGDSSDSRSHTNYSITYWQNPQGVRISYEYTKSNNSQHISKIKYGSLNTNSPTNEIRFNYGNRLRREQSYVNNVSIIRSHILKSIESYSGGIRYRKYQLYHGSNDRTTLEYERLSTVTEHSGDDTELHSSIVFTYSDSASSIGHNDITTSLSVSNIEQRNAQAMSLDMTGNGEMDFIVFPNAKDKFWMFYDLQSGGNNYPYQVNTGYFKSIFPSRLLNSGNKVESSQGLTVVQKGTNNKMNFKVYSKAPPSSGGIPPLASDYTKIWNAPLYNQGNPMNIPMEYVSGDFNGDGLTDVLAIGKPYGEDSDYKKVYFINLRRDIPTGFASLVGNLSLNLSGSYKLKTGDFNGDGKTDLYHITNGKVQIYSLTNSNILTIPKTITDSSINTVDTMMLGDFNGDGNTDFMVPIGNNNDDFKVFISTATGYVKGTHDMPFTYRRTNWDGDDGVNYGHNLIPLDVNGDGKTDIVEYNTVTHNEPVFPWIPPTDGTQTVTVYNNLRIDGSNIVTKIKFENGGTETITGDLKHYPIPIYLTSNQQNKSLDFASISDQYVTNFSFSHDHREDVLLNSITNNGTLYEIDYSNLDPSLYNSEYEFSAAIYENGSDQIYPNIDLKIAPSTRVVSAIRRYGYLSSGTVMSKKVFFYKGAVYNSEGEGFLGFSAIARSNWHIDSADRIFHVSKYNTDLKGAMTEEYSMPDYFSFIAPTSNYISKTTYQYSSSLSNSKVFRLWLDSSVNQNYLEGTFTNTTYSQYDAYNNPINITTTFMGGSKNQVITYSNNTGSNYHIGRPMNTVSSTTLDGDTFSTEEEFSYTGYLLTQRKIKGNGTPFNIETYNYDSFGNIIKKTTTPNGESSREVEFEYDSSGRFLVKSIDIEGLETDYEYGGAYGDWNLTKETNPFGQETNFEYDSWDRLIKVTDYLGKESTTNFTEVNNAYTVTNTAEDGSGMIVEYDQLQRVSVIKEKDLFGDWVSKKYEYDVFDRLIKESEPYTGNSPTQWSETTYDLYSRPISQTLHTGRIINISYNNLTTTVDDGVKTITSTRNQFGNLASVTDPGGTINYTYYGNGNLKTANNNGVLVSSEQDGWGRQTKLIDPSAGTYEYSYNGFGELKIEETPKGRTDYFYTSTGQLSRKFIIGDNTEMDIRYTYNPTDKLLSHIQMTNSNGSDAEYYYSYDNNKRLTDVKERNEYTDFLTTYTYDDFGRVETERYQALLMANGKSSDKKIRNEYSNGYLQAILDFSSQRPIWEVDALNARSQITSAKMGNGMQVQNRYNSFGYLTDSVVEKDIYSSPTELMHLKTNFNIERGTLNIRSNSMFSWSEEFEYDGLDRLISFNDNNGNNNHQYDDLGRITYNNDIGDYNYSGTSYKVDTIDLNTQGNQYYQQNTLQQVTYNAFKKPVNISELGKEKIDFQYNAFMGRSHMFYGNEREDIREREKNKHYDYTGRMEISYDLRTESTVFVTYIGGDAYSAPAIWRSEYGEVEDDGLYYLFRDYLGSIMLITDQDGKAKEKRHFDAWGNIVIVTDGNDNELRKLTFLDRGYTGHEHLSGVGLIHMNGRLYDPKLKRFLSPDNYIQDITNTQNFNRYGYVLNNPLMYIDPSGETGENPGLSGGEQAGLGALIASGLAAINWEGLRMRDVSDWTTKHIFSPFNDAVDWVEGWFKKKSTDREYSNYEGLSSDPMAGSSNSMSNSFFNAGGTESGLGIFQSENPNDIAYELYKNATNVLPEVSGWSGSELYNTIFNGHGARSVDIGGESFHITSWGTVDKSNFVHSAVVNELATFFTPAGAPFRFASTARGLMHYAKHVKNIKYVWKTGAWKAIRNGGSLANEFKSFSAFVKGAQSFFTSKGPNFLTYVNSQGTIFKLNVRTGHFGVANTNGVIQTFYKIETKGNKAFNYFIEQVAKY
ncbi:RHS repeat-associated core domain-containing protein [Winogradskyella psychrotolerans]|uniref:RHS repeat-associated core domain-containing protein n=1 Tax=Winogradskyella psychrotolerans TaxID=1344585 RepID=UPI001C070F95|nr:RHS repeat-associated core domain-containing protein [Winogradskyella psychrotolerans]MBU2926707.1 VCBS repeat-containing protein [Winogradskyella psychrotolerans]